MLCLAHHAAKFPLQPTMAKAVARHRTLPACRFLSSTPVPLHPYKFHIGLSWAAKPPEAHAPASRMITKDFPSHSHIVKWREETISGRKLYRGVPASTKLGEDFFFVQEMRNMSGVCLGVADGVGGWVEEGIDPSLFSQSLMYHAHRYAKLSWAGEPEIDPTQDYEEREQVEGWELTPRNCLQLAFDSVLRDRLVSAGSSTACLATLNSSSGILRAANLGDSGVTVIRSASIIYTAPPQTHYFNCPRQLTKFPQPLSASQYQKVLLDLPEHADQFEMRLRDGDIVILYTDGLSDNVFSSELVQICSLVGRSGESEEKQSQDMAHRIVQYARACMSNINRVSPFEKAAARHGKAFTGGKMDDVTVLVVMVREI